MTTKFKLLITLTLLAGWMNFAEARLIAFSPSELNLGSVAVGDTGWRDVRFRYSGPDSGIVNVSISGGNRNVRYGLNCGEILGAYQPTIAAKEGHAALGVVSQAVDCYVQDFGELPPYLTILDTLTYIDIPASVREKWDFRFSEGDSIASIIGVSTALAEGGAGHEIGYDRINRMHTGWGLIYDGVYRVRRSDTFTLSVWFAPYSERALNDSLRITATFGNSGVEVQYLVCSGSGYLEVEDNKATLPMDISLAAPYPNPFNSTTSISFTLPEQAWSRLTVFNAMGEEVAVLRNGESPSGEQRVIWNATGLPSGVYYPTLMLNGQSKSVRAVFVR